MIWLLSFVATASVGNVLWGALGSRLCIGHVVPDSCVMVLAFIGLRRGLLPLAVAALLLGGLLAHDSLGALGLHTTALLLTALGIVLLASSLAAAGRLFFALTCAVAATAHEALLYLLLLLHSGRANFASWAPATLVLTGLLTGLWAFCCEPWLVRLDAALSPRRPENLLWRS